MLRGSQASLPLYDEVTIPMRLKNPKVLQNITNCSLVAKIRGTYEDPYSMSGESHYNVKGLVYRSKDCLVLSFHPQQAGKHIARIYCDGQDFGPLMRFTINSQGRPVLEGRQNPSTRIYGSVSNFPSHGMVGSASNATNVSTGSTLYGTVGHVKSMTGVPFGMGQKSGFTANYLAPSAKEVENTEKDLEAAELIQQQKRNANLLTFTELHRLKRVGLEDSFMEPSTNSAVASTMKHGYVTSETLKLLQDEAQLMASPRGARKRCNLCGMPHKAHKFTKIWEIEFCDLCLQLNYMQHSFIDHFMVPTVQDAELTVPLDKRGKKLKKIKKRLPVANLRGVTPTEIRFALDEFHKFSMDGTSWIDKAVLLPLVKSVFSYKMKEQEIKAFLGNASLKAMLLNMGLEVRDHVHEIEYLSLVAFVAREIHLALPSKSPYTRFTPQDLEMALSFQLKFGLGNVSDQVEGAERPDKTVSFQTSRPPSRTMDVPSKRDTSNVPASQSFEWRKSPDKDDKHTVPHHKQSPIYEDIGESQRNFAKRGNNIHTSLMHDQGSPVPKDTPTLPQRPAGYGKSKKGHKSSPEKNGRLAPIGGVTKTNPLHMEPEVVTVAATGVGQLAPKDTVLPTEAFSELKLTGGESDGWMLY